MDTNKEIYKLQSDVEFLRRENERMQKMIDAVSENVTFFFRQFEQLHKWQKSELDRADRDAKWIEDEFLNIWNKLSPAFRKLFPGQVAVENQIDRILNARSKNRDQ